MFYSVGTQVVTRINVRGVGDRVAHPAGAVGVIVREPSDQAHAYRVKFADGLEAAIDHDQLMTLSELKSSATGQPPSDVSSRLSGRIIYQCVMGSRAFGLDDEGSDTDRRGIYLPPAELHWSLYGVPEQLENDASQEVYWELQKFLVLALKANPNVLECLYSPLVEMATPLANELLGMRDAFLSKLVYQTFSGYVASQFKKMQTDQRNQGRVKPKHVMHLNRLLISGIGVLTDGTLRIDAGEHRERLLAIKRGEMPFQEANQWRKDLQRSFEAAFRLTRLPDRPDYERVNEFLVKARQLATQSQLP